MLRPAAAPLRCPGSPAYRPPPTVTVMMLIMIVVLLMLMRMQVRPEALHAQRPGDG